MAQVDLGAGLNILLKWLKEFSIMRPPRLAPRKLKVKRLLFPPASFRCSWKTCMYFEQRDLTSMSPGQRSEPQRPRIWRPARPTKSNENWRNCGEVADLAKNWIEYTSSGPRLFLQIVLPLSPLSFYFFLTIFLIQIRPTKCLYSIGARIALVNYRQTQTGNLLLL